MHILSKRMANDNSQREPKGIFNLISFTSEKIEVYIFIPTYLAWKFTKLELKLLYSYLVSSLGSLYMVYVDFFLLMFNKKIRNQINIDKLS